LIRDDIENTINEYAKAMQRRRMSIVQSALTAFVLPAADILTNPAGHHLPLLIGRARAA
jgi:hypothetical protein